MSNISHHLTTQTIAAYSAGHLDEARMVVIATHLDGCDRCAKTSKDFEDIGGVCIDMIDPTPMTDGAVERFWKNAAISGPVHQEASLHANNDLRPELAYPLHQYLKGGIDNVKWKGVAPGVEQHILKAHGYRQDALRLLKIQPGTTIPEHTHGDNELTLILRGAYEDALGHFGVGDIADLSDHHTHSPKAIGDEPCICLIATSAPLKFKGLVGKVLQPFVGL